jgi:hypothetical protein
MTGNTTEIGGAVTSAGASTKITVKDSTISRMLADKRWSNFVPHHFSLYMFGQCKVCRRKVKG